MQANMPEYGQQLAQKIRDRSAGGPSFYPEPPLATFCWFRSCSFCPGGCGHDCCKVPTFAA
jgi:hypothetical protein